MHYILRVLRPHLSVRFFPLAVDFSFSFRPYFIPDPPIYPPVLPSRLHRKPACILRLAIFLSPHHYVANGERGYAEKISDKRVSKQCIEHTLDV